jgi:hypothetical protein
MSSHAYSLYSHKSRLFVLEGNNVCYNMHHFLFVKGNSYVLFSANFWV